MNENNIIKDTIENIETIKKADKIVNGEIKEKIKNKTKIGFFLLAFGDPYIEFKLEVLKKNLEIIKKVNEIYEVDLYIFLYTIEKKDILNSIHFNDYVSNFFIHIGKGIIGEFIYKHISKLYKKYQYILFFLDDIEFPKNFDMTKLITIYTQEKLDILGLPLSLNSPANYNFMKVIVSDNYNYRETNFIELFVYLMDNNNFKKYLSFFDKYTKWCWGIDLSLYNSGLKLGIYDGFPIQHYFKAKSYAKNLPNALDELYLVKQKYVFVKEKKNLKWAKY